jgi:hypothetical protein
MAEVVAGAAAAVVVEAAEIKPFDSAGDSDWAGEMRTSMGSLGLCKDLMAR